MRFYTRHMLRYCPPLVGFFTLLILNVLASPVSFAAASSNVASLPVVSPDRLMARLSAAAARPDVSVSWDERRGIPFEVSGGDLLQELPGGGKVQGASAFSSFEEKSLAVMASVGGMYGVQDALHEFKPHKCESSATGFRHVRMDQEYQGLPVFGGQLIVHYNAEGRAQSVNGIYTPVAGLATNPVISSAQAESIARADQASKGKPEGALKTAPALVVYAFDHEPALAYELMLVYSKGAQVGAWKYWVDARTGLILACFNNIKDLAPDPNAGSPSIIYGGRLPTEGGEIVTNNAWYGTNLLYYLTSFTNRWLIYNMATGEFASRYTNDWGYTDRAEMSAANNVNATQLYYRNVHHRDSVDDGGYVVPVLVHQTGMINAFWDGNSMTMNIFDDLPCSLDIIGHELTHGVTEFTANFIYLKEPGALDESFSDIFGSLIEFYTQPDGRGFYPYTVPGHSDWVMGEDSSTNEVGIIRDMRDPWSKGQPSRYKGTFWDPGQEVHQNNGVQNHYFYLLCEGGTGTNDGIADYNVPGIGIDAGGQVAYETLAHYAAPGDDYAHIRVAWLNAAYALDTTNVTTNAEVSAVMAWMAVGVGPSSFVSNSIPFVSMGAVGSGPYLPAVRNYNVLNLLHSSLTWDVVKQNNSSWLTISNATFTLAGGKTGSVSVAIDQTVAATLPRGIYHETLLFTNKYSCMTTKREVVLRVGNNYALSPEPYNWIDPVAKGHQEVDVYPNDVSNPVSLPFYFSFYNDSSLSSLYSGFYISARGMIGFLSDWMAATYYDPNDLALRKYHLDLPFGLNTPGQGYPTDSPSDQIYVLWSKLNGYVTPGKIYYGIEGTAPNRKAVVTWINAPHDYDTKAVYSFQVIIPENTYAQYGLNNDLIFNYKEVSESRLQYGSGLDATIGLVNLDGSLWDKYSYNGEYWLANNRSFRFTQEVVTDTNPPVCTDINPFQFSGTTALFEVKFSETVTGLSPSGLYFGSGTTVPGISIGNIYGSGMRYLVEVTGVTSIGRIELGVTSNAVTDLAGNANDAHRPELFVVPVTRTDFSDSMEGGATRWTVSTQGYATIYTRAWECGVPSYSNGPASAYSGSNCWGTILSGDYPNDMNAWVMTPPILVGSNPTLDLEAWYNLEFIDGALDRGYIEAYDGSAWYNVTPNGYFGGFSSNWVAIHVDLDNDTFGNRMIQLRFRATSGASGTRAGFYVDDVAVHSLRAPGLWVSGYTPTNGSPSTSVPVTFNLYNSTISTSALAVGSVSSPDPGVTIASGSPITYGVIPPGIVVTAAAPVLVSLGSVGNFATPLVSLVHQAWNGGVAGVGEPLPFQVDGISAAINSSILTVRSSLGVTNWLGNPIQGNGGPTSALFQVIYAGANRTNDMPLGNGQVSGDDQLLYTTDTQIPYGRFGEGNNVMPDIGSFLKSFAHSLPSNSLVYVRAWDGATPMGSSAYGDSRLYPLSALVAQTNDFGRWCVGRPAPGSYNRDDNSDSLPDGWCVLHNLDSRDPVAPLGLQVVDARSVSDVSHPCRVAVSSNFVFIADTGNQRVQVWDRVLTNRYGIYSNNFNNPYGIAVNNSGTMLAVACQGISSCKVRLLSVNRLTGALTLIRDFGSYGVGNGQFNQPMAVSFGHTGELYVADSHFANSVLNNRIQVFTTNGDFLYTFGAGGTNVGQFYRALGVGVGQDGTLYVADGTNNRVQAFNGSTALWEYGHSGTNYGQFNMPWDIQPGLAQLAYVADSANNRIQVVDLVSTSSVGAYLGAGWNDPFSNPRCAVLAPDDNVLYVADYGNNRVLRLKVLLDMDGDGMDDVWEVLHGLNPRDPSDANVDPNHDGVSNLGAYRAGLDPNQLNAGVNVVISSLGVTPQQLGWLAASGYVYQVQTSTNLLQNAWINGPVVTSSITGWLSITNTYNNTNVVDFIRVLWINAP